jgi:CDP-paratose 2-epimerase
VRDQIHANDVARTFLDFYENPRCGEVYNLGGGRDNALSIHETISALKAMGFTLESKYVDKARVGDHICYISDLSKIRKHFPKWKLEYDLKKLLDEIVAHYAATAKSKSGF